MKVSTNDTGTITYNDQFLTHVFETIQFSESFNLIEQHRSDQEWKSFLVGLITKQLQKKDDFHSIEVSLSLLRDTFISANLGITLYQIFNILSRLQIVSCIFIF
jgi:hypothetical protein